MDSVRGDYCSNAERGSILQNGVGREMREQWLSIAARYCDLLSQPIVLTYHGNAEWCVCQKFVNTVTDRPEWIMTAPGWRSYIYDQIPAPTRRLLANLTVSCCQNGATISPALHNLRTKAQEIKEKNKSALRLPLAHSTESILY